ncbi:hypothetical protein PLESTB_000000900 [Pleodorina starrii]|uniref:ubiquitinyl hydrolase 1 n=1 Tax=Pleodorina starrii TaxID=330485 RepID=A0A9W6B9F6_9CHLO|nr:hypothetical protein PLESTB_000000900 [Pleodorina starrii]
MVSLSAGDDDPPNGSSGPHWCEPEELLHSLYNFTHAPASSQQSLSHIEALCGLLERFEKQALRTYQTGDAAGVRSTWTALTPDGAALLHTAFTALRGRRSRLTWLPDYGCALLGLTPAGSCLAPVGMGIGNGAPTSATPALAGGGGDAEVDDGDDPRSRPGELALHLVALDGWAFYIHSTPSGSQRGAQCGGHTTHFCGSISAELYDNLVAAVRRREEEALRRTQQAFRHTADFIYAAVCGALAEVAGGVAVVQQATCGRGGFTDVGPHSGADTKPDTCWPLVKAVLQVLLEHFGACDGTTTTATITPPLSGGVPAAAPPSPSLLFRQALAHLDLWLLHRQLRLIRAETATPLALTSAMQMLAAAATKAATLAADGYDMSAFEAACRQAEQHLRAAAGERALIAARALELPPADSPDFQGSCRPPCGVLPPAFTPGREAEEQGLAAARQRASRNLGSVPLLPPGSSSFRQVLAALSQPAWSKPDSDVGALLALRSVERELFYRATMGSSGSGSGNGGSSGSGVGGDGGLGFDHPVNALSADEVAALEQVLDAYRVAVQRFLASPAAAAQMRVEQMSREVMAVWVGYCLMHTAARLQHPQLESFGAFSDHTDLRHLVLSDRLAVDAALAVAAYLQRCKRRGGSGRELFSLRDGGAATLDFAQEFASACPRLQGIWQQEHADAQARVDAHWRKVRSKQTLLAKLRNVLLAALQKAAAQLQEKLRKHKQEVNAAEAEPREIDGGGLFAWFRGGRRHIIDSNISSAKRRVQEVEAAIADNKERQRSIEAKIMQSEAAPPPVIQPLPASRKLALRWLFFLHMPPLLRHLSRVSFLAQQMLLPRPCGTAVINAIRVRHLTSIVQHYNNQRQDRAYISTLRQPLGGTDGRVMLWSDAAVPSASNIGPKHVDYFRTPSDGVWYPDSLDLRMAWGGSGAAADQGQGFPAPFFNAFAALEPSLVELYFTERLPPGCESLQWAMHVRASSAATPAERGNIGIAQQDTKPSWLSKPAFLDFTRLRSYPLGQLRRLAAALHDRTLPLAHPAVHSLVRQLLYHLGNLTDGGVQGADSTTPPQLLWRTGWLAEGDVLEALHGELAALAEELETTPREHEAVLLLGEVASYLSAWHPPCGDIARRFAAMTRRVADELEPQVAAVSSGDYATSGGLLAKQCRWRCMALMCWAGVAAVPQVTTTASAATAAAGSVLLTEAAAQELVTLMVQVNHGRVFLQRPELQSQLAPLLVRAHGVLAAASGALMEAVGRAPHILTQAVARVLQQRTPDGLNWRRLADTGSFEAVDGDQRLFSINILDGTVLFDGWPPGRLPKDFTAHPLYRRTFGDWNFDVALASDGVMRSLRPVGGRMYDFEVSADGQRLAIVESDPRDGTRLELLDVGPDGSCGLWGAELPLLLRLLYSHWLCRERGVLVLRPRDFQQHDVHYVIRCSAASSSSVPAAAANATTAVRRFEYDCRRVPPHLRPQRWSQLLSEAHRADLPDRLVLLSGSTVKNKLLAKLEHPDFIHAYVSDGMVAATHGPAAAETNGPLLLLELPRFGLEFELRPTDGSGSGGGCGQVLSRDYAGYRLHRRQLLVHGDADAGAPVSFDAVQYTLPEFRQCLVLERVPGTGAVVGARREDVLVLLPAGGVVIDRGSSSGGGGGSGGATGGGASVRIEVSSDAHAHVKVHCYEVHGRFGHLRAASIPARLQLAALYAATGTLLPEPGSRSTGGQMAMQLLRQCWTNRPLGAQELAQLRNVGSLGGHLVPGLRLLVHELELSASELRHLHEATTRSASEAKTPAPPQSAGPAALDPDAAIGYQQMLKSQGCGGGGGDVGGGGSWPANPRLLLTPGEEMRTLGTRRAAREVPAWLRLGQFKAIEIREDEAFPVEAGYVAKVEERLSRLLEAPPARKAAPPYPLQPHQDMGAGAGVVGDADGGGGAGAGVGGDTDGGGGPTPLELEMHGELRDSWEAHHLEPELESSRLVPGALEEIATLTAAVQQRRAAAESYLMHRLTSVPADVGPRGSSFRLLRCAGVAPTPGPLDLMAAAWRREAVLAQFNPFLSHQSMAALHSGVLVWLQLCVLEDRLARLGRLATAGPAYHINFVQELLVRRVWDPAQHPQWLVFEAEGQLQIRPAQLAVATCGGIWLVVRLNFLSTLLEEAYGHLHQHLCAGVLGRKLFVMPFHRDVQLTTAGARAMRASLLHCKQEGGLLLTAPEHRLSLLLKRQELWAKGHAREAEVTALDRLAALPYLDLMDERDELLHHRLQLVYACGDPTALPGLQERTAAMQALLHVVSRLAVAAVPEHGAAAAAAKGDSGPPPPSLRLLPPGAAVLEPPPQRSPGGFCGLRLLPGDTLTQALQGLHRRLAEALMDEPPYELRWLRNHPLQERILRCVTDASESAAVLLGPEAVGSAPQQLSDDQLAVVLALRGLLGCNLLQHCLQKRHLVDYGVNRHTGSRKRMAVPYRAAHMPSERSEFAQPDVALLLTNLSYYYDGLSHDEFLAALTTLLRMGPNAQRDYYQGWLRLGRHDIPAADLASFDCVSKVDVSNRPQMELMHTHMRHNMALVDFWLTHCVFPTEGRQFPQRLGVSAWNLADNNSKSYTSRAASDHIVLNTAGGAGEGQQQQQQVIGASGSGGGQAASGRAAGVELVVGFSGTNDNHRLLPLQVHQAHPEESSLRATNGKMLSVILNNTLGYTTLRQFQPRPDEPQKPQPQQQVDIAGVVAAGVGSGGGGGGALGGNAAEQQPLWQVLCDTALAEGVDALLDCGALLAGASNREAAEYLLGRLDRDRYQGVTFYDEGEDARGWVVADLRNRRLPRHASPVAERETLVIFDDARCRGADLQLRPDAVGLLTLGPGVCKDKLMQAAGRLRQLGRGQRLHFAAAVDITAKIRQHAPAADSTKVPLHLIRKPNGRATSHQQRHAREGPPPQHQPPTAALHVLRWVMYNTVQATLRGVVQWSNHGLHFAATKDAPARALHDEVLELGDLYGGGKAAKPIAQVVAAKARHRRQRCSEQGGGGGGLDPDMDGLMSRIEDRAALYGRGCMVAAGTAADDEECERELEEEEEEDQEVERQVARVSPAAEQDWEYGAVLGAVSTARLDAAGALLVRLAEVVPRFLQPSSGLGAIPWSREVLCTTNFLLATPPPRGSSSALNEYLRPVDAMLLFPSGETVLISEREADQLQALAWANRPASSNGASSSTSATAAAAAPAPAPLLVSLSYARDSFTHGRHGPPPLAISLLGSGTAAGSEPPPAMAAAAGAGAIVPAGGRRPSLVGAAALVSVQLFNGEASYSGEVLRKELRSVVWRRRGEVETLVGMRGKQALLPRSDLERACDDA